MRRSLIVTVAATVAMVLVAMLVPMAVLVQSYALEDRLSRAALEVQATETVVSGREDGRRVGLRRPRQRRRRHRRPSSTRTAGDRADAGEDARVEQAGRPDGRASTTWGAAPDPGAGLARREQHAPGADPRRAGRGAPAPGSGRGAARRGRSCRRSGLVLLAGAVAAGRPARPSFVQPIARWPGTPRRSAKGAGRAGRRSTGRPRCGRSGPRLQRLVDRIEVLLERERAGVADLSHRLRTPVTALRLRADGSPTRRGGADLGRPRRARGHGRPPGREARRPSGRAGARSRRGRGRRRAGRFWRRWPRTRDATFDAERGADCPRRRARQRGRPGGAAWTRCSTTSSATPPRGRPSGSTWRPGRGGRARRRGRRARLPRLPRRGRRGEQRGRLAGPRPIHRGEDRRRSPAAASRWGPRSGGPRRGRRWDPRLSVTPVRGQGHVGVRRGPVRKASQLVGDACPADSRRRGGLTRKVKASFACGVRTETLDVEVALAVGGPGAW